MDRRETERLLDAIRQARAAGEPAAMATVVRVKGSAYRREGTRMFVRRNGTYECALSGGCLEPTVAEAAARVIATGEPVIVSYDLADDSIWGLGIGCSGAVDIRIERIGDDAITRDVVDDSRTRGGRRARHAALRRVGPDDRSRHGRHRRRADRSDRRAAGGRTVPATRLRAPYPASGPERLGGADLFYEITLPPPDLVIFGAGHDAAPVARLAWTLGFAVTVVDVREAFLTPERFPAARRWCARISASSPSA